MHDDHGHDQGHHADRDRHGQERQQRRPEGDQREDRRDGEGLAQQVDHADPAQPQPAHQRQRERGLRALEHEANPCQRDAGDHYRVVAGDRREGHGQGGADRGDDDAHPQQVGRDPRTLWPGLHGQLAHADRCQPQVRHAGGHRDQRQDRHIATGVHNPQVVDQEGERNRPQPQARDEGSHAVEPSTDRRGPRRGGLEDVLQHGVRAHGSKSG